MNNDLGQRIYNHLEVIYDSVYDTSQNNADNIDHNSIYETPKIAIDISALMTQALEAMRLEPQAATPPSHQNQWSERDIILISYGDSIVDASSELVGKSAQKPLETLKHFIDNYTDGTINSLHILPFFPFSSDDGFSVIDFMQVNPSLGDWQDITTIASEYRLMADLVINHCSQDSVWFKNFIAGQSPGKNYFYTEDPEQDTSRVVRPRTNPLLQAVETKNGVEHVWCTFSHDQVDLDFRNPQVLIEFIKIVRYYLDKGVRIFRLDAVAFVWKKTGTSCINLKETHEIVRLLRLLIEHAQNDAIIITETNIPNRENLEYFGNANEAHCIYNFSLPPLLVHTLISGNSYYLKQWMMSMPPAQNGTTYFNFIASHDGIGLRPTEGLLSEREIDNLSAIMENFGGRISYRELAGGKTKPYEINISLFDALQGTHVGPDKYNIERFICAHAIMLALEGIPGIYIHSLMGTRNDYEKCDATGHNRAINRHQWNYPQLQEKLADPEHQHAQVFAKIKALLAIRIKQPAFHPNATQFTLHLGDAIFGFWRQSHDRQQSIFCIANIDKSPCSLPLSNVNLIGTDDWVDLISGTHYADYHNDANNTIELAPYQTVWITNRPID